MVDTVEAPKVWLKGAIDRAIRTGLQILAGYLSVGKVLNEVEWLPAILATAFAVILSLLTSYMTSPSFGDSWGYQLLERATKTFVQSLLIFIGTAAAFAEVDWKIAFSSALTATFYSIVTSVLSTKLGPPAAKGQIDVSTPPVLTRAV